jgi:ABC-type nitrate/sulfonate/bicarbonate transport system substrate-binding protein
LGRNQERIFYQQGLDVQLVLLRGVPMTLQALAAGSLHFGSGGPEPYIEASERGLDFVVTGGIINGMAQFLIAGRSYKKICAARLSAHLS